MGKKMESFLFFDFFNNYSSWKAEQNRNVCMLRDSLLVWMLNF